MPICQRCAGVGRDCCRALPTDDQRHRLGLTIDDVIRMSTRLGRHPADFAVIDRVSPQIIAQIASCIPGSERMFPHGLRITFKLDERGVCVLCDPERGCLLTLEDRPRFCALYPSWYDATDFNLYPFMLAPPERCLAVEEAGVEPEVLYRCLRIDPHTLVKIARASDEELRRHAGANAECIRQGVEG